MGRCFLGEAEGMKDVELWKGRVVRTPEGIQLQRWVAFVVRILP